MCRGGQTQKLKVQILCFSDKGGDEKRSGGREGGLGNSQVTCRDRFQGFSKKDCMEST